MISSSQRSEWANAAKKATTTPLETLHDGVKYFSKVKVQIVGVGHNNLIKSPNIFDVTFMWPFQNIVTLHVLLYFHKNISSYNNRKIEEICIPRWGKSIKMRIILQKRFQPSMYWPCRNNAHFLHWALIFHATPKLIFFTKGWLQKCLYFYFAPLKNCLSGYDRKSNWSLAKSTWELRIQSAYN